MIPIHDVHETWHSLLPLYLEELVTLEEQVLPNISYQPQKNKIFQVFNFPLTNINVVDLHLEVNCSPRVDLAKSIQRTNLELQGVFFYPTALTVQTGSPKTHRYSWMNFSIRVIDFISSLQPCIWRVTEETKYFIPYIKNPFFTKAYDKTTIKEIPIHPDYNYIIAPGDDKSYEFTNTILSKLRKPTIEL